MVYGNCHSCGRVNGGYMTVYLTMTMAVLLSLCMTLIEGARSNGIILESEIASDIAVNSIMAEYNRELMKQYNIFAIEDSYGSENASLDNTEEHLKKYLNGNLSSDLIFGGLLDYRDFLATDVEKASLEGVLYLTDDNGAVFMRRAYEAIKDDIGIDIITEIQEWTDHVEAEGLEDMNLLEDMESLQSQADVAQIEAAGSENSDDGNMSEGTSAESSGISTETSIETSIETSDELSTEIVEYTESTELSVSPGTDFLSGITSGVLYSVVDDTGSLSAETVNASLLVYSRMQADRYNLGNLKLEEESTPEELIERYVFQEYLLRYMGRFGYEGEDALKYQIEYIIAGGDSDINNLSTVVNRIFVIRFAEDYICLSGDSERCSEAETYADVISGLTYTEGLADVYKEIILLAWSANEALYDTRSLMAGNRVELIKTKDNWHTSINGSADGEDNAGDESGLTYTDYLRIFMTFMSKDKLVGRAMDMVEADIRMTDGNEKFRLDACIDTLCVDVGVRSAFGYSYDFMIKRRYE